VVARQGGRYTVSLRRAPKESRTLGMAPKDGHGTSLMLKHEGGWDAIRATFEMVR